MNRHTIFFKNYFRSFYDEQTNEVKAKIDWTLILIRQQPYVPQKTPKEEIKRALRIQKEYFDDKNE